MGIFDFLKRSKNICLTDLDGGTGRSETYHDNGKGPLMCHKYFIRFKLHGKEQFFYRNGQIKFDWNWKDNKKDGTWRSYEENGQLVREEHFKDDILISEKCWDKNGTEIKCK